MVIIQPATGKAVILRELHGDGQGRMYEYWFLPKGRKDVGESLEQTALREAYEEVCASVHVFITGPGGRVVRTLSYSIPNYRPYETIRCEIR